MKAIANRNLVPVLAVAFYAGCVMPCLALSALDMDNWSADRSTQMVLARELARKIVSNIKAGREMIQSAEVVPAHLMPVPAPERVGHRPVRLFNRSFQRPAVTGSRVLYGSKGRPLVTASKVLQHDESPGSTSSHTVAATARRYTVKRKDTLWAIARAHRVSIPAIMVANPRLSDAHVIQADMVINIPQAN